MSKRIIADGPASKALEGPRPSTVRAELESLVTGVGFEPERPAGSKPGNCWNATVRSS